MKKRLLHFKYWKGRPIKDDYNGKPLIDYKGRPLFAELVVLNMLKQKGWNGVWVDCYHKKFRKGMMHVKPVKLPPGPEKYLKAIIKKNGKLSGCWDIFAWKGNQYQFVELKRRKKDKIRDSQKRWYKIIRSLKFLKPTFTIVEWDFE